jgi:WD40 repeat protein
MKNRLLFTASLIVLLALTALPGHAQDGGWRVESFQPLGELLGGAAQPTQVFLAPDGLQVAYEQKLGETSAACARNIATGEDRCVELPAPQALSLKWSQLYPPLAWSPDSTKLAVVGVPYIYLRDTDLTVADLTTLSATVLADDQYTGKLLPLPTDGVSTEVQPVWSPDGMQIAVERAVVAQDSEVWQAHVSIFTVSDGSVRDLTLLPGHEEYTVDGGTVVSMAWSPDGSALVISLRHPKLEPAYDGIWMVDVASGKLTQLVTVDQALQAILPFYPSLTTILAAAPVALSPDGSRLLFWTGDLGMIQGFQWAFWIESGSGTITPVPLPTHPDDKPTQRMISPTHAVWSPDGRSLLVVARHLAAPDPAADTILAPGDQDTTWLGFHLIDVASGQDTVLGYAPYQAATPLTGVWSADGHVIVAGYAFTLAE